MVKNVNITTTKPIYNVFKTPIVGTVLNTRLSTNQIYTCLAGGARVDEILSNGKKVVLGINNYNKDNEPKVDINEAERKAAELKAKEEAEKKAAELKAQEEAKAKAEAEKRAREEAERKAAELKAKEEAERLAAEKKAKEEAEKKAAELKAQVEKEEIPAEENKEDVNSNQKNSNKKK